MKSLNWPGRSAPSNHRSKRRSPGDASSLTRKCTTAFVHFEDVAIARYRLLKARLSNYIFGSRPATILTAPAIYALIIPLVLLDLFVAVYQTVCFPVYARTPERLSGVRPRAPPISMPLKGSTARTAPRRTGNRNRFVGYIAKKIPLTHVDFATGKESRVKSEIH